MLASISIKHHLQHDQTRSRLSNEHRPVPFDERDELAARSCAVLRRAHPWVLLTRARAGGVGLRERRALGRGKVARAARDEEVDERAAALRRGAECPGVGRYFRDEGTCGEFCVAAGRGGSDSVNGGSVCGDALDDVESGEEDELRFFVCAHALDVRFECFDDVFAVLQGG